MSIRVLLTGGTGFLGRHIAGALLEQGICVRLPIRREMPVTAHPLAEPVHISDLFTLNYDSLHTLLQDVDTVIHAAWYTNPKDYLFSDENLTCLSGTLKLAKTFTEMGGRRFVGIGSFFEYDSSYGYMRTTTPLRAETLYAHCKIAAWNILNNYFNQHDTSFLWLRLFSIYGQSVDSGEHASRIVPYIHQQLSHGHRAEFSAGTQVRDYLEVTEAAHRIVSQSLGDTKGAANICSGRGIQVRELVEQIADLYGRRDLLDFGVRSSNPYDPPFIVGQP